MAEGGYDPNETNPFNPNEGADDRTALIPHHTDGDEMEMTDRTSTPMTSTSKRRTQTTTFMGETPSGIMQTREESQDRAVAIIKEVFPNADTKEIFAKIKDEVVYIKIKGIRNIYHPILDEHGNVIIDDRKGKFPKTLRDALGKSLLEIATILLRMKKTKDK